ncbi:MAG TPA: hypothetical protein VGK19_03690 [Capsulimonadaceae bacterium]
MTKQNRWAFLAVAAILGALVLLPGGAIADVTPIQAPIVAIQGADLWLYNQTPGASPVRLTRRADIVGMAVGSGGIALDIDPASTDRGNILVYSRGSISIVGKRKFSPFCEWDTDFARYLSLGPNLFRGFPAWLDSKTVIAGRENLHEQPGVDGWYDGGVWLLGRSREPKCVIPQEDQDAIVAQNIAVSPDGSKVAYGFYQLVSLWLKVANTHSWRVVTCGSKEYGYEAASAFCWRDNSSLLIGVDMGSEASTPLKSALIWSLSIPSGKLTPWFPKSQKAVRYIVPSRSYRYFAVELAPTPLVRSEEMLPTTVDIVDAQGKLLRSIAAKDECIRPTDISDDGRYVLATVVNVKREHKRTTGYIIDTLTGERTILGAGIAALSWARDWPLP